MSESTTPRGNPPAASGFSTSVDSPEPSPGSYPHIPWNVKTPVQSNPTLRCRRYLDGMVSVPWDLIRDPKLGQGDKTVACALAAKVLPRSAEVLAPTRELGKACGISRRAVQEGIRRLRAAGWVELLRTSDEHQRKIVLLWLIPDDGEDLIPCFAPRGGVRRAPAESSAPAKIAGTAPITPLFPAMGGEP
jgi:hypothetical protein